VQVTAGWFPGGQPHEGAANQADDGPITNCTMPGTLSTTMSGRSIPGGSSMANARQAN
jgi:hypothetical protein